MTIALVSNLLRSPRLSFKYSIRTMAYTTRIVGVCVGGVSLEESGLLIVFVFRLPTLWVRHLAHEAERGG